MACGRVLYLANAEFDITLAISHMPGKDLTMTADALSHWHMGQHHKDNANQLIRDRG